jgi:hypothetical protein
MGVLLSCLTDLSDPDVRTDHFHSTAGLHFTTDRNESLSLVASTASQI